MTVPPSSPRKTPPPAALIALGTVFLCCGVVFLTSFETFVSTVAATTFMVAGGILGGVGAVRLLRARGDRP